MSKKKSESYFLKKKTNYNCDGKKVLSRATKNSFSPNTCTYAKKETLRLFEMIN